MQEGVRARLERLEQAVADEYGTQCGVTRRDALGRGEDVGIHAESAHREVVANATKSADGLVGNEQHVVLVTNLTHSLEVAGWGMVNRTNRTNAACPELVEG